MRRERGWEREVRRGGTRKRSVEKARRTHCVPRRTW